ncbi:hypothetical protein Tco_0707057 [Tanacetum coccineum]|uniref:Uncharacterized protein n=1 Tax=Tanacetum coccineum TaxID=301880 RepID=A0ABQ4Y968_9ASTR
MTDYSLWEVIKNGNKVLKRTVRETEQEYKPTTVEKKQDRRNEMKARGTLLMALPNKDQLKFHSYKDAKLLMEALEKSSETIDHTFDRSQKLITQLEIQGEIITQEDMNLKLLRSLPSEWKTHALIWRNKQEIETISLDDLYSNLKIYEPKISGSSSITQNLQNVAFVSSNSNSSKNEADNTAYEVSATHTQSNPTSGDNLKQIDPDDLEEMDLQWEMAMLTIRARRFIKRTGRQLDVNGQRKSGNRGRKINRRTVTVETPTENALVTQDGIRGYDWSYQAEEEHPTNFSLMTHTSSGSSSSSDSEMLENQENNKSKSDKGYHAVPPPFTGNFMPRKPDLTFMDEIVEIEPKIVRKNSFRPPVIKDWNSDDESEVEIIPKDNTVSSSTEKIKLVKTARETVVKIETSKQNKHYPRGNQRN